MCELCLFKKLLQSRCKHAQQMVRGSFLPVSKPRVSVLLNIFVLFLSPVFRLCPLSAARGISAGPGGSSSRTRRLAYPPREGTDVSPREKLHLLLQRGLGNTASWVRDVIVETQPCRCIFCLQESPSAPCPPCTGGMNFLSFTEYKH